MTTKNEFLLTLRMKLSSLPQEEIEKTISFYNEMIDDRMEEGMSEAEAVSSMEDIDTIVQRIMDETPIRVFVKERMKGKNINVILLIATAIIWVPLLIGLLGGLFGLIMGGFGVVLGFFAAAAGLGVGGIVTIIGSFFVVSSGVRIMFLIGLGLICIAVCIVMLYVGIVFMKWLWRMCIKLYRWVKSKFMKKESVAYEG